MKRHLSIFLTALFFATNCVLAYSPQTNLWARRRKRVQLAQLSLPHSAPFGGPGSHLLIPRGEAIPSSRSGRGDEKAGGFIPPPAFHLTSLLQCGSIREVSTPKLSKPERVVLYIQDIHQNSEAQENIARALRALMADNNVGLIALEGAFGSIDLSVFQKTPYPESKRRAADYLLRKNKISGPIEAVMTSGPAKTALWGVDDEKLYRANVKAYREAARRADSYQAALVRETRRLAESKRRDLNLSLRAFDHLIERYRRKELEMGEYIRALSRFVSPGANSPVHAFLTALDIERSLDFRRVEKERSRLLKQLAQKLAGRQTESFVQMSLAYRTGKVRHGDFYRYIQNLCQKSGVPLAQFPAMAKYIRYLRLSEDLNSRELFGELRRLEKAGYEKFIRSQRERDLIKESRRVYLLGKLLDFALTGEEWREYQSYPAKPQEKVFGLDSRVRPNPIVTLKEETVPGRGNDGFFHLPSKSGRTTLREFETLVHRPPSRVKSNERGLSSKGHERSAMDLTPFEDFYRLAERRDEAIASNLVKSLDGLPPAPFRPPLLSVLVTGGFHSLGVTRRLREKGYTVISFVPKITEINNEDSSKYLSVFAQEKTPLDKLFEGEKLFLAQEPAPRGALALGNVLLLTDLARLNVYGGPLIKKVSGRVFHFLARFKRPSGRRLQKTVEITFDAASRIDSVRLVTGASGLGAIATWNLLHAMRMVPEAYRGIGILGAALFMIAMWGLLSREILMGRSGRLAWGGGDPGLFSEPLLMTTTATGSGDEADRPEEVSFKIGELKTKETIQLKVPRPLKEALDELTSSPVPPPDELAIQLRDLFEGWKNSGHAKPSISGFLQTEKKQLFFPAFERLWDPQFPLDEAERQQLSRWVSNTITFLIFSRDGRISSHVGHLIKVLLVKTIFLQQTSFPAEEDNLSFLRKRFFRGVYGLLRAEADASHVEDGKQPSALEVRDWLIGLAARYIHQLEEQFYFVLTYWEQFNPLDGYNEEEQSRMARRLFDELSGNGVQGANKLFFDQFLSDLKVKLTPASGGEPSKEAFWYAPLDSLLDEVGRHDRVFFEGSFASGGEDFFFKFLYGLRQKGFDEIRFADDRSLRIVASELEKRGESQSSVALTVVKNLNNYIQGKSSLSLPSHLGFPQNGTGFQLDEERIFIFFDRIRTFVETSTLPSFNITFEETLEDSSSRKSGKVAYLGTFNDEKEDDSDGKIYRVQHFTASPYGPNHPHFLSNSIPFVVPQIAGGDVGWGAYRAVGVQIKGNEELKNLLRDYDQKVTDGELPEPNEDIHFERHNLRPNAPDVMVVTARSDQDGGEDGAENPAPLDGAWSSPSHGLPDGGRDLQKVGPGDPRRGSSLSRRDLLSRAGSALAGFSVFVRAADALGKGPASKRARPLSEKREALDAKIEVRMNRLLPFVEAVIGVIDERHTDDYKKRVKKLLFGTAMVESWIHARQQKSGPARGLYQMEPWVALNHLFYYFSYSKGFRGWMERLFGSINEDGENVVSDQFKEFWQELAEKHQAYQKLERAKFKERHRWLTKQAKTWTFSLRGSKDDVLSLERRLEKDDLFATLLARLHYLRVPSAIPASTPELARYWKEHWNTRNGKGKPSEFVRRFAYVARHLAPLVGVVLWLAHELFIGSSTPMGSSAALMAGLFFFPKGSPKESNPDIRHPAASFPSITTLIRWLRGWITQHDREFITGNAVTIGDFQAPLQYLTVREAEALLAEQERTRKDEIAVSDIPKWDWKAVFQEGLLTKDDQKEMIGLASKLAKQLDPQSGSPAAGSPIAFVNATKIGGGVAEMRPRMVALLRALSLHRAAWWVIDGADSFFKITSRIHTALHNPEFPDLTGPDYEVLQLTWIKIFERWREEKILDDLKVLWIDDPQPVGLIPLVRAFFPSIQVVWRVHVDTSDPQEHVRAYLADMVEGLLREGRDDILIKYIGEKVTKIPADLKAHAIIFHDKEFVDGFKLTEVPDTIIAPSIDPLAIKNMSPGIDFIRATFAKYGLMNLRSEIPPVVVQISRFDPMKGPIELITAFVNMVTALPESERKLRDSVQLVLAGNIPADNGEGREIGDELKNFVNALDVPDALKKKIHILQLQDKTPEELLRATRPEDSKDKGLTFSPAQREEGEKTLRALGHSPTLLERFVKGKMTGNELNDFEVAALQAGASVRAQFSSKEGFGLVVAEAMVKLVMNHWGVMVGTRVGGIKQQIVEGAGIGVNYKAEDVRDSLTEYQAFPLPTDEARQALFERVQSRETVRSFSRALRAALQMPADKKETMNREGREHILKNFTTVVHGREIITMLMGGEPTSSAKAPSMTKEETINVAARSGGRTEGEDPTFGQFLGPALNKHIGQFFLGKKSSPFPGGARTKTKFHFHSLRLLRSSV